jgi:wyosine [tRNA(Phe)-imidazoG37] synthetase (radical SAM superfamily)
VDPIALKACNWNCIYCQLGRTEPQHAAADFPSIDAILEEVRCAVAQLGPEGFDWLTLVGSGEPTLHPELDRLLQSIRAMTPRPLAVITNGSLLERADVRAALRCADAVLPTLDAGSDHLFRKINRPWGGFDFERYVAGLIAFRKEYSGQLWVEVMLLRGLNDTPEALADLAALLERIQPDQVHLNRPTRPPCEPWAQPADDAGYARALAALGRPAQVVPDQFPRIDLDASVAPLDALAALLERHPMTEPDLLAALQPRTTEEVRDLLTRLHAAGRIQRIERGGIPCWSGAQARFAPDRLARCHAGPKPESESEPGSEPPPGAARAQPTRS